MRDKLIQKRDERGQNLRILGHECLWACKHSCAILLQDQTRTGYIAGYFSPEDKDTDAILDWCLAHAATKDGNVPFINWPQGMRGHFIARIPANQEEETK